MFIIVIYTDTPHVCVWFIPEIYLWTSCWQLCCFVFYVAGRMSSSSQSKTLQWEGANMAKGSDTSQPARCCRKISYIFLVVLGCVNVMWFAPLFPPWTTHNRTTQMKTSKDWVRFQTTTPSGGQTAYQDEKYQMLNKMCDANTSGSAPVLYHPGHGGRVVHPVRQESFFCLSDIFLVQSGINFLQLEIIFHKPWSTVWSWWSNKHSVFYYFWLLILLLSIETIDHKMLKATQSDMESILEVQKRNGSTHWKL